MLSRRYSLSLQPFKKTIRTQNNDEYIRLKRKLTQTTAIYGTSLTMSYFIGQGMEAGISSVSYTHLTLPTILLV